MAKLITLRTPTPSIVDNDWTVLRLGEGESPESVPLPDGPLLVPLAVWKARQTELAGRPRLGVWLAPAEDAADLADDLSPARPDSDFPENAPHLVAVDFPKFTDGRGYSTATLLRTRFGYRGELRAIGDILRDQLYFYRRVGFDSFALRADRASQADAEQALKSLADFDNPYQGAVDDPRPLFARLPR